MVVLRAYSSLGLGDPFTVLGGVSKPSWLCVRQVPSFGCCHGPAILGLEDDQTVLCIRPRPRPSLHCPPHIFPKLQRRSCHLPTPLSIRSVCPSAHPSSLEHALPIFRSHLKAHSYNQFLLLKGAQPSKQSAITFDLAFSTSWF